MFCPMFCVFFTFFLIGRITGLALLFACAVIELKNKKNTETSKVGVNINGAELKVTGVPITRSKNKTFQLK